MIPIIDSLLQVVGASLKIWDYYNKTKFYREYKELMLEIQEEAGKGIYNRDQAKIDRAQYKLMVMLSKFNEQAKAIHYDEKDI
jgi:hypothetical protein